MANSLIQGCAVIIVLAIFQPANLKTLKSETNEETLGTDRNRKTGATDDGLVYPDGSLRMASLQDPSPCPDGQDYCETADDYPTNLIQTMIKKQPKYILNQFYVEVDDTDIDKFFPSSSQDEHPLCASSRTVIYPKKAKSKEGLTELIVNVPEHMQGVRVESCASSRNVNQCNIPGNLASGYVSHCVQKHIQRTLVVVDKKSPGGSGFITKPFDFPSCCSCMITMTSSGDRFGISPANTTATAPPRS